MKNVYLTCLSLVALLFFLSAPVCAQNEGPELTLSYFLGGAHTLDSDLKISQPGLGNQLRFDKISFAGRSFENPLYYGIRAGFYPRRASRLGVEAEFVHLKVYAKTGKRVQISGTHNGLSINRQDTLDRIVQNYSISHGVNLLLVNGVLRHAIQRDRASGRGRVMLAGRFGIGATIPHTESTIDGLHQEQYQWGRFALQISGGAELRLWRGLYAISEYKFTYTNQQGKVVSGEAESRLRSHHGAVGVSYHF
jgi:opacity protein-like surface antigen